VRFWSVRLVGWSAVRCRERPLSGMDFWRGQRCRRGRIGGVVQRSGSELVVPLGQCPVLVDSVQAQVGQSAQVDRGGSSVQPGVVRGGAAIA